MEKITNKIIYIADLPYSFVRKDGEHISGVCRRAVMLTERDGNPSRLDIVKCSLDFDIPPAIIGKPVTPLYDRFGRLVSWAD